ncbi:hypothetical protein D3C78_1359570 [compost metagenome]
MLPSALPAFSAPTGVRVVPSLAASSGETAAMTLEANRESARAPVCSMVIVLLFIGFIRTSQISSGAGSLAAEPKPSIRIAGLPTAMTIHGRGCQAMLGMPSMSSVGRRD